MRLTEREQRIHPKSSDYGRINALAFIKAAKSTRDLKRRVAQLPMYGCGWRSANYRITLEAAIKERSAANTIQ